MRGVACLITALGTALAEGTQFDQPRFSSAYSTIIPTTTTSAFLAPMMPAGNGFGSRSTNAGATGRGTRSSSSSSSSSKSRSSGISEGNGAAGSGSDASERRRTSGATSLAACGHERISEGANGLRRRRRRRDRPFSSGSKHGPNGAVAATSLERYGSSSRAKLQVASPRDRDGRRGNDRFPSSPSSASSSSSSLKSSSSSSRRRAFAAAVCTRGGGSSSSSSSSSNKSSDEDLDIVRPVVAAAVGSFGGDERKKRLAIDRVEDAIDVFWRVIVVPTFNVARFCFGLSLLFYGMAFRTFAFHVIVFRLAGLNQVQRATRQLVTHYREARKTIRDAADKAETVGERVVKGDELQKARKKMIEEKQRLLASGYVSEEETRDFMRKYKSELLRIKEEQEFFQSARSSVLSVRRSVDPQEARSSISGVYNALVTSFTASTIQSAGQLTLGLHVGSLLKTHILDLFGPILDPIGYRLDLATYYKKEDIPYMGKANALDGPQNLALNILCYSAVFLVFQVHPSIALKSSMVYYGARVVTDYIVKAAEMVRRRFKVMSIVHTPWSAAIHAGLTILGFLHHREVLYTAGVKGVHPLIVGPGLVGLVEPLVRFAVALSEMLNKIDFFSCTFVNDPAKAVKEMASVVS